MTRITKEVAMVEYRTVVTSYIYRGYIIRIEYRDTFYFAYAYELGSLMDNLLTYGKYTGRYNNTGADRYEWKYSTRSFRSRWRAAYLIQRIIDRVALGGCYIVRKSKRGITWI